MITDSLAGIPVLSILVLLGLMSEGALAQGWYTGNAGGAATAGAANNYAPWASATAQDGSPAPGGWGQQPPQAPYAQSTSPYGYGYPAGRNAVADPAGIPRAVTWSRRPPPIAPPVQYLPQPRMPAAATWDPRVAQVPAGYAAPSAGPYGARQFGAAQYNTGSPSYQPIPYQPVPYQPAPCQPAPYPPAAYQPVPAQPLPNQFAQYSSAQSQPAPNQAAQYQPLPVRPAAYQPAPSTAPAGGAFAPPPLPPPGGAVVAAPDPAAPQPSAESATGGKLPRNEEIIAYVGPDVILMGDVLPEVEHALKQALKGKTPPDDEMDKIKASWIRGRLKGVIEVRQVLVYVKQQFKDDEGKYREIRKQMGEAFEKKHVKTLIEQHKEKGVTCRADLEQRSVELFGSPFSRVRESFIDQTICYSFINQKLPKDEEIAHADALAHYQSHEADYGFPAKARWEQITVKYGPGTHTRDEAWRIIAQCGNAIIGGARFDAIARQHSEDPLSAKNGGTQDWIGQGSLVCEKLDAALFDPRLPVGTLSPAIEDGDAFHIIRVVERRTAGKTPFAEAQKEIKEKLKKERQDEKREEFMETIRKQVPVRNVFEEQHPAPPPQPARPQRSDDE